MSSDAQRCLVEQGLSLLEPERRLQERRAFVEVRSRSRMVSLERISLLAEIHRDEASTVLFLTLPQPLSKGCGSGLQLSLDRRCPSREKSSRSVSHWTVSCGSTVTPERSPRRAPTTRTLCVMCATCWRPNSPRQLRAVSSRHGSTNATLLHCAASSDVRCTSACLKHSCQCGNTECQMQHWGIMSSTRSP